jgi:ribosomal protein S1
MIEPLELEWREIKPEMIVKGKVIRLESYGAFIEIGAERPGLIHVSEISHNYIKSPSEVIKEGDEVTVMILDVNRRKKQIRLSMKAILPKEVEEPLKIEKIFRRKKEKNKPTNKENVVTQKIEPELTAMEIAWRSAMERAESNDDQKQKPTKSVASDEREDILKRTLKHRLPNG